MKFGTDLDLNKNQLLNVLLQNLSADPTTSTAKAGQIYFNTTDNVFKYFNGTEWIDPANEGSVTIDETVKVSEGGTGVESLTEGEVLVGNGTNPVTTLAIDTEVTEDSTNLITSGAVKTYADEAISTAVAAVDAMVFKGTVDSTGVITSSDDTINGSNITALSSYSKGWTFRASGDITTTVINVDDTPIETGDMIIVLDDSESYSASNFAIIQVNTDGVVIGPDEATDGAIAVFDGTTGKLLKVSNVNISDLDALTTGLFNLDTTEDADVVLTSDNETTSVVASGNTVTATLSDTGVTAGTYGDNSTIDDETGVTGGDSIVVPSVTVDSKGRITSASDKTITINITGTVKRYDGLNGTLTPSGGACSWTVEHDLNCQYPTVSIYEVSTGDMIIADVTVTDANTLTITINSDSEISAGVYHCTIVG